MPIHPLVALSLLFVSIGGTDFVLSKCSQVALNKWFPDHNIILDGNFFKNNGFWFGESSDQFFGVPSYRFIWPSSEEQIFSLDKAFWPFLASCFGAESATFVELTDKKDSSMYNDFQEFSKFVQGKASFFEVTLHLSDQKKEIKNLAYLALEEVKNDVESDLIVFDNGELYKLLSFKLPFRVAPYLSKAVFRAKEIEGTNIAKFTTKDNVEALIWEKGTFKIEIEFGESELKNRNFPSVRVSCPYQSGTKHMIRATDETAIRFCELYQALDKYLEDFADKSHPDSKENFPCDQVKIDDYSDDSNDIMGFTFGLPKTEKNKKKIVR